MLTHIDQYLDGNAIVQIGQRRINNGTEGLGPLTHPLAGGSPELQLKKKHT